MTRDTAHAKISASQEAFASSSQVGVRINPSTAPKGDPTVMKSDFVRIPIGKIVKFGFIGYTFLWALNKVNIIDRLNRN